MSRVGLVIAAVAGLGAALAGCSGMGMSDMFSSQPATPPMENVQFESQPPGAEVRSEQGQTCLTPCGLSIPAQSQAVTINKIGFVPQTIQITAGDPPDHSFWESTPPPTLVPNPVQVVLQAVPPPAKPVHRHKPRQVSSRTRTAAKGAGAPPPGDSGSPFPDPPPGQSGAPSTEPAGDPGASPFPPPPGGGQQ
jgi:PEGA domain